MWILETRGHALTLFPCTEKIVDLTFIYNQSLKVVIYFCQKTVKIWLYTVLWFLCNLMAQNIKCNSFFSYAFPQALQRPSIRWNMRNYGLYFLSYIMNSTTNWKVVSYLKRWITPIYNLNVQIPLTEEFMKESYKSKIFAKRFIDAPAA